MHRQPKLRTQLLSCGHGLPANAANLSIALFDHYPNATHRILASNFSFSANAAAASLGDPGNICVDRCFCGTEIRSSVATGVLVVPSSCAVTRRSSFVLAFLMPINVA